MPFALDYPLGNLVLIGPTGESGVDVEAPVNTVLPVISGIVAVGHTLTVSTGTWTGTPTYTYQWYDDGVPIVGATGNTLLVTAGMHGSFISARVVASNSGGNVIAFANAVGPVNIRIVPAFIAPTGQVFAPVVIPSQIVQPSFIAAAGQVFTPVVVGPKYIQIGYTAPTGQVFAPNVARSQFVQPSFIAPTGQVFAPEIAPPGYFYLRGKDDNGNYVTLTGQNPDTSYTKLIGKAA